MFIRSIIIAFLMALTACGEATSSQSNRDASNPQPRPNRDFGVRPEVGTTRDMATRADMNMEPPESRTDSRSTFFPGEYIPYGQCPNVVTYGGQMTQEMPQAPNGGHVRTTAYPGGYDGGIRDVLTHVPPPSGNDDPPPVDVDLALVKVTVVATRPSTEEAGSISESQARFWVADAHGTIEVYLDLNQGAVPPFTVRVGQVISLRATQVGRYGDRAQIRRASEWASLNEAPFEGLSAGPNGEVSLYEPAGELTVEDVNRVIRVTGLLEGEADGCGGGHFCWQLNYGGGVATFRSRDEDLRVGTCITYVGPLSSFRGALQLEPFNPLWARRYQRGSDAGEECDVDSDCTTNVCLRRDGISECGVPCESDEDCPLRTACSFNVCLPRMGSECPETISFEGQLQGMDGELPNGGVASYEPLPETYDTGLAGLLAQIPPIVADGDPPSEFVNIAIERATIVATRPFTDTDVPESQGRFWVADGRGQIEVFLDLGIAGGTPNFPVRVGQVISFTATRIGRYQQKPQITAGFDWQQDVDEPPFDGGQAGPDAHAYLLTPEAELGRLDVNRLVRITGRLDGDGGNCGSGSRCWTIDYGFGEPLILRTAHEMAETGHCVTFVGPLSAFRGDLQLDTVNLAWLRVYN
jgi:hypothetical protein